MEAKQRSEFSTGELQLIAYLAILRENRRKAGKANLIPKAFIVMALVSDLSVSKMMGPFCSLQPGILKLEEG